VYLDDPALWRNPPKVDVPMPRGTNTPPQAAKLPVQQGLHGRQHMRMPASDLAPDEKAAFEKEFVEKIKPMIERTRAAFTTATYRFVAKA